MNRINYPQSKLKQLFTENKGLSSKDAGGGQSQLHSSSTQEEFKSNALNICTFFLLFISFINYYFWYSTSRHCPSKCIGKQWSIIVVDLAFVFHHLLSFQVGEGKKVQGFQNKCRDKQFNKKSPNLQLYVPIAVICPGSTVSIFQHFPKAQCEYITFQSQWFCHFKI